MKMTAFGHIIIIIFVFILQTVLADDRASELPAFWNKQAQDELNLALKRKENTNVAKNVILFLGDGNGVSTVTATRILKGQQLGKSGEEALLPYDRFPNVALCKTYNTDAQVADSAGTATAYLTGVKTKFGVIGVDDRIKRGDCSSQTGAELTSILNWSQAEGKSTGFVTTTRVTHATPSALYANAADRDWEDDGDLPTDAKGICKDIALQLFEKGTNIQVIMGGGRGNFMPDNMTDPEYSDIKGKRKDHRNLIQEWIKAKADQQFKYVWNKTEFDKIEPVNTDYVLGLFEPSHMKYVVERNQDRAKEPTLVEMTEKALKILQKNNKGYFLLVEGGRIDHGHHDGKAVKALNEGVEFADAIDKAVSLTNTEDTLIVVTADHSHVFNLGSYTRRGSPIFGLADPMTSIPPLDNMPFTILTYGNGPGHNVTKWPAGRQNLTGVKTDGNDYEQQTAFPLKWETHGGEDVAIYAQGPMSHLFHGVHEQNYIAHVMAYASCVGTNRDHCVNQVNNAINMQTNSFGMFCVIACINLFRYFY